MNRQSTISNQQSAISVKDLSVAYDRKRVLSNLFFDIEEGHRYGILGPNGSGKSTLLKAILGLIPDYTGEVTVLGKDVSEVRKRVVYVPQRSEIDFTFPATVRDVVLMGRYPHKRVFNRLNKEDHRLADEALDELGIVNLQNRQIGELSGGQQQRTFLARALTQQADVLLLDEPFVGVDIPTEEKIIAVPSTTSSCSTSALSHMGLQRRCSHRRFCGALSEGSWLCCSRLAG